MLCICVWTHMQYISIASYTHLLSIICHLWYICGIQVISPEEFRTGCGVLNEHLPEKQRLTDIDHMLALMDFDGNGMVDINEFFEVCVYVSILYMYICVVYLCILIYVIHMYMCDMHVYVWYACICVICMYMCICHLRVYIIYYYVWCYALAVYIRFTMCVYLFIYYNSTWITINHCLLICRPSAYSMRSLSKHSTSARLSGYCIRSLYFTNCQYIYYTYSMYEGARV